MATDTERTGGIPRPPSLLRQQAEERLRLTRTDIQGMPVAAVQQLVYELQVHQIELELQNEELQRAQRDLALARDQYTNLYDFAPVGYLTVDAAGVIVGANLTATTFFGVERQRLLGRRFSHFVAPVDQDTLHRHYQAVRAGGGAQTCELPLQRAHGGRLVARVESVAAGNAHGDTGQYRTILSDVTARTRAEDALRDSEQRRQQERELLYHIAHELVSCPDMRTLANIVLTWAQKLLGADYVDLMEVAPGSTVLTGVASTLDNGTFRQECIDAGEELAIVTQAFQQRKLVVVEEFARSPLISERLRQHYYFLRDVWSAPMLSGAHVVGVLTVGFFTHHEATANRRQLLQLLADEAALAMERARLTEEVEKSEQELTDFFEHAPLGLHWVGPDGIIQRVNQTELELLGYTQEEYVGHPIAEFHADPDVSPELLRRLARNETVRDYEVRLRGKDRAIRSVLLDANVLWEAGTFLHARCFLRDNTGRRQAEDTLAHRTTELERLNVELQQFAYVTSHDLQEPLRTISTFIQLLEQHLDGALDARGAEFIKFTVEGAQRMQALIRDLLAYTHVGGSTQAFAAVDGEALLVRVLGDLRLAIDDSGAEVSHDTLPTLHGDAGQLGLVLQNLIGNALKFRSQAPLRIHVTARRGGGQWEFAVRDNGIGIEPRHAERIFQVFQRLHTRSEYPGTGVGLAICKKIIERHGGRIWVESAPGRGTTCFFTLSAPE
jgi:PAS domain S-box-containing protein